MSSSLFISYSHKDEEFMRSFEAHLSGLKRSGDVSVWHDRKIVASSDWKGKISENLETSDVVIFLISADFIASDYCHDIEMKRALERHSSGGATVMPVVVRPCDWMGLGLASIQALPEDAKAVSKWANQDEAWVNVIEGIKDALKENRHISSQSDLGLDLKHCASTEEWVNDTEVKLSHRRVSNVTLADIYVESDVVAIDEGDMVDAPKDIYPVGDVILSMGKSIVFGDEQIGKTAFLKYAFNEYFRRGYCPVYIRGEDIKSADFNEILEASYYQLYEAPGFSSVDQSKIVVLIDDVHMQKLNPKFFDRFIEGLSGACCSVIFTAQDSYQYVCTEYEALDDFRHYELRGFGNANRYKLIKKWFSLGVEQTINDDDLHEQCDESKERLDSVIRRNIVPSKPIYILSLLQIFEAYRPQDLELTSYGHCYQHLIYQALERANIKTKDIEKYLNVLGELSYWIYKSGDYGVDKFELQNFFNSYEKDYILEKRDRENIIENLLNHSILINRMGKYSFKYPYIYYFFVAKRMAESLTATGGADSEISSLLDELHKEDASNILIFITHHTKDERILGEIQSSLFNLFSDEKEATLSRSDLGFMEDFLKEIPELVIEHKKGAEHRELMHAEEDKREPEDQKIRDKIEGLDPSDVLAKINKAFKGMELIGQIVRNRHASMKKGVIKELVSEGYGAGLRFLSFFLSLSDVSKDEVIKTIEYALQERPNIPNEAVEKLARNTFLMMTYGVINGVIRKIGASLGSREALQIYEAIEAEKNTPAVRLVNQGMRLSYSRDIDIEHLGELNKEFQSNPTCLRILKELVVEHLYMFPSDYKDKQRISEALGIPMKSQRVLQLQKKLRV